MTHATATDVRFAEVPWSDHQHHIEYAWVGEASPQAPVMVFLHEGLGSLELWKDFPHRQACAAGCRGLVLSRWGYGRSSPRASDVHWPVEFMHRQAHDFLPAFFAAIGLDTRAEPPWLFGHSDGASIALLFAGAYPDRVSGVIAAAPHIFVEDVTVASIELARQAYLNTDLPRKLARYHADPDSAFWGWNRIWLDPAFKTWNLESDIARIRCPLLAVQGHDDEYGTMAQIDGIARLAPQTQRLKLERCGHSPHRDQPEVLIQAVADFLSVARHPAG
ncbi:MAG: alpha/beta fold hydrolase [Pigmentiphaga sp.]